MGVRLIQTGDTAGGFIVDPTRPNGHIKACREISVRLFLGASRCVVSRFNRGVALSASSDTLSDAFKTGAISRKSCRRGFEALSVVGMRVRSASYLSPSTFTRTARAC